MVFSLLSFRPRPLARPACASPVPTVAPVCSAGSRGVWYEGERAHCTVTVVPESAAAQTRRNVRGRQGGGRALFRDGGNSSRTLRGAQHVGTAPPGARQRQSQETRALQSTPQSDAAQGRRSVENLGFSAVRFWLFSFFVCSDGTRPPLRDAGLRCRFRWRPRRVGFFPECFPSPGLKLLLPVFAPGLGFGGRAHRWDKPRQVEGRRGRK